MKATCCICRRSRVRSSCTIIVLREDERRAVEATGVAPLDEYVYCKPCWKTISHPVSGPALMRGLAQLKLRQQGVKNADEIADRFQAELTSRAARPKN